MKIIVNTIASYSRTLISILLVLFSSRWVLLSLGVSDFGIYSLIGSLITIIVFFNTVFANANSRFIAIELGKKNNKINDLFKTIVTIHIVLPIIILFFGYFIGVYAINNILDIPHERIYASIYCFKLSIISAFFAMIAVPFSASFIANQNIVSYSLINLLQSTLYFLSAFCLRFVKYDPLISYSFFMSLSNMITYSIIVIVAMFKYKYCTKFIKGVFNKKEAISITKYSFWNFVGNLGHLCRTQGVSIIVNLSFGTYGNAALGIANQVSTQSANLTNALSTATAPEIYKRVGSNDFNGAKRLVQSVSKIGVFFILLLSAILVGNIDEILLLWLRNVPPYTEELCICFIVMYIIEKIPLGENSYLSAINKISLSQSLTFICYLLAIIFPYIGLIKFYGIIGIGMGCVLSMILNVFSIIYCYNKYSGSNVTLLSIKLFFFSTIIIIIALLNRYLNTIIDMNFILEILITFIIVIPVLIIIFYSVLFNEYEKIKINNIINKFICKKK